MKSIEQEQIDAVLNCDHDFYGDISQDKNKDGVADAKIFCDKCGLHYIVIAKVLQEEYNKLNAPKPCTTIEVKITSEGGQLEKVYNKEELKNLPFFNNLLREHKNQNETKSR